MDWHTIGNIKNENDRIIALYDKLDESNRLKQKNCSWVEYLTVTSYFKNYFKPHAKILDVGAGTGAYSLHLAEEHHEVTAIDLSENNINKLKENIEPHHNIKCEVGNAINLDHFDDDSFDGILLMGPLYHILDKSRRIKAIKESLKKLKSNGYLFISFMNNDIAPLFLLNKEPNFFSSNQYNHNNFKMNDWFYVFHTIENIRELCAETSLNVCKEIAMDGISLVINEKINHMDKENFENYMRFHQYMCEKKEYLAASSHVLIIAQK